ncbi:MAG: ATP-binding protein [Nitrososphaerales archaeon]
MVDQERSAGGACSYRPAVLAKVIADEVDATRTRRLSARLRFAYFPFRRSLEEYDFDFQPSVDRKVVLDLAELDFIREGRPLLFRGKPGCGKNHLAVPSPCGPSRRDTALFHRGHRHDQGHRWARGQTEASTGRSAPTAPRECSWSTTWASPRSTEPRRTPSSRP